MKIIMTYILDFYIIIIISNNTLIALKNNDSNK